MCIKNKTEFRKQFYKLLQRIMNKGKKNREKVCEKSLQKSCRKSISFFSISNEIPYIFQQQFTIINRLCLRSRKQILRSP